MVRVDWECGGPRGGYEGMVGLLEGLELWRPGMTLGTRLGSE